MWIFPGINEDKKLLFLTWCLLWPTMFEPLGTPDQWCKEKGVSRLGKGVMWSEASSSHTDALSSLRPASIEHLLYVKNRARPKPIEIIPSGKQTLLLSACLSLWAPRILYSLHLHTSTNSRSHSVEMTFPASVPSNIRHMSQGQMMCHIYLCIPHWASPEPSTQQTLNKCLLNFSESLEILCTWLTPHSDPESSPFFYTVPITLNLSVSQSFPKNISIWRQGRLVIHSGTVHGWVNGLGIQCFLSYLGLVS